MNKPRGPEGIEDQLLEFEFDKDKGERLDKYLVEKLPDLSRARIQGLIGKGMVLVDSTAARKTGQTVERGQKISVRIPPPAPSGILAEEIPLEIIFENDDLMVVNKPAGMVVHPAAGHPSGTLVNAALGYDPEFGEIGGEERPGIVHRLDKETSGLIVMARNDTAHRWLQEQFRTRKVEKVYLASGGGKPADACGQGGSADREGPIAPQEDGDHDAGQRAGGGQRIQDPANLCETYAAGIPPAHRTDAPDTPALRVPGMPDRRRQGVRAKKPVGGDGPSFSACGAVEDHPAGRNEAAGV